MLRISLCLAVCLMLSASLAQAQPKILTFTSKASPKHNLMLFAHHSPNEERMAQIFSTLTEKLLERYEQTFFDPSKPDVPVDVRCSIEIIQNDPGIPNARILWSGMEVRCGAATVISRSSGVISVRSTETFVSDPWVVLKERIFRLLDEALAEERLIKKHFPYQESRLQ